MLHRSDVSQAGLQIRLDLLKIVGFGDYRFFKIQHYLSKIQHCSTKIRFFHPAQFLNTGPGSAGLGGLGSSKRFSAEQTK
jgi:hypothetical protein